MTTLAPTQLLTLLQLASPALPVGAYSYSEGLETLVEQGVLTSAAQLQAWLQAELARGTIRTEAAIAYRAQCSAQQADWAQLAAWNRWLSAARETEELRQQSWQMGRSLLRLLLELDASLGVPAATLGSPCNYAIAYGLAAAHWQLPPDAALLAYLQSWAANLIVAGVKSIPLGQTAGQQVLVALHEPVQAAVQAAIALEDAQLDSCAWGTGLASLAHAQQYSRLFRS